MRVSKVGPQLERSTDEKGAGVEGMIVRQIADQVGNRQCRPVWETRTKGYIRFSVIQTGVSCDPDAERSQSRCDAGD